MKKTNIKYWAGTLMMFFVASACEDNLNINDNPNSPVTADVQLVLPQAIVSSASVSSQFNNYGGHFGGFISNAGGFSGFGNLLNYNLTPGDYNGMWVSTYQDPLPDLKYVIDNTEGDPVMGFYNAAAKIMTVVNFQRLVDAFGDVPYSEALRGEEGILAPAYDEAGTIYQDLYAKLDEAIALLQTGIDNPTIPLALGTAADPLFSEYSGDAGGQALAWQKFANTLKLRILIRLSSKGDFNAFVTQGFASLDHAGIGFIDDDAIVDPGYELNRPNPAWATWGRTIAGALSNSSRIPTTFSFAFYNGVKIDDNARGEAVFVNFPATPNNQLGNEDGSPTIVAGNVTWASNQAGLGAIGVLKGPAMGQPLMLEAEARFLQAEAQLRGFLPGDFTTTYFEGIEESFAYLYKNESETVTQTIAPLVAAYRADNSSNRLVEIALATTEAQRLEAIITQKYIALNMINSDEAWNEYRRTGFPTSVLGGGAAFDIASNKSAVTGRPDRLPTRVLYPSSEQSYNAANFRTVNYAGELIFWDPN
jgi:hypothetical protein